MPSILLYKESDHFEVGVERSLKYNGDIENAGDIMDFINMESLPLLIPYREEVIFRLYTQ